MEFTLKFIRTELEYFEGRLKILKDGLEFWERAYEERPSDGLMNEIRYKTGEIKECEETVEHFKGLIEMLERNQ